MDEIKLIELNYLGMLEISGEGSFDLLQGQITCDLNKINSSSSSLGALCNSKGRVLSSFIVSSSEVTRFILIGPSKMMEKHNAMFDQKLIKIQTKMSLQGS